MMRLKSLSSGEEPKLPEDEACGLVLAGARCYGAEVYHKLIPGVSVY